MPDIQEYVSRLLELKRKNPAKYAETMKLYQEKYPDFYAQLMTALPKEELAGAPQKQELKVPEYNFKTRVMDFVREYWAYLIFISAGLVVVIILLIMLLSRYGSVA